MNKFKKEFRERALQNANTGISKAMMEKLDEYSIKMQVPKQILISRAIANELDSKNPFEVDFTIPSVPFDEENKNPFTYKLYEYIKKNQNLSIEHLVLLRDDIGIREKDDVLLALRDLVEIGMIVGRYPQMPKFPYPRTYKVYKINTEGPL